MREPDAMADIRAVRDELARRHGDAWALSQALAERSRVAGRVVVRFPPRPPQPPRIERGRLPAGGAVATGTEAVI